MSYNWRLPDWQIAQVAAQVSEQPQKQELIMEILNKAREQAAQFVEHTLWCAEFLDLAKDISNDRQHKVLKQMMNTEMTAKKYQTFTGCSKATATRELSDMFRQGLIKKLEGRGRSTVYVLNF